MNAVTNMTDLPNAAALQSTFNAWHIVALGLGAFLAHGYHVVVAAGGLKMIWRNFWNGQAGPAQTTETKQPVN
jgi:hypothetical protein